MFVIVLEIFSVTALLDESSTAHGKRGGGKWISPLFYELSYSFARKASFLGEVVESPAQGKRCPTLSTLVPVSV